MFHVIINDINDRIRNMGCTPPSRSGKVPPINAQPSGSHTKSTTSIEDVMKNQKRLTTSALEKLDIKMGNECCNTSELPKMDFENKQVQFSG